MGRIRTKYIKRISRKLVESYRDKFSKDFEKNKKAMAEIAEVTSKKLRNKVAGCVTHLIKTEETN